MSSHLFLKSLIRTSLDNSSTSGLTRAAGCCVACSVITFAFLRRALRGRFVGACGDVADAVVMIEIMRLVKDQGMRFVNCQSRLQFNALILMIYNSARLTPLVRPEGQS